jgi:hypothetical protein
MDICSVCGKEFKNYGNSKRTRCGGCNTKIRRYRAKIAAVKYKGGKCVKCGWAGNIAAFEFHHKNPEEKDFQIGNVANKKWEIIRKELDKCDLLCSNCHQIEHSNNLGKEFLNAVDNYKGRLFD